MTIKDIDKLEALEERINILEQARGLQNDTIKQLMARIEKLEERARNEQES